MGISGTSSPCRYQWPVRIEKQALSSTPHRAKQRNCRQLGASQPGTPAGMSLRPVSPISMSPPLPLMPQSFAERSLASPEQSQMPQHPNSHRQKAKGRGCDAPLLTPHTFPHPGTSGCLAHPQLPFLLFLQGPSPSQALTFRTAHTHGRWPLSVNGHKRVTAPQRRWH